jgi:hypothetical protein
VSDDVRARAEAQLRAVIEAMDDPAIGDIVRALPECERLRAALAAEAADASASPVDATAVAPATAQPGAVRPPGCAPDGNHASVEVVPTILLNPLDVVWHEDRWHAVIDDAANDESSVTLAPIIDDAGGQGDEVEACAEFFLRCATLPAPAVEEARRDVVDKAKAWLARPVAGRGAYKGTAALEESIEALLAAEAEAADEGHTLAAKESRSDDRPAAGQGGGRG